MQINNMTTPHFIRTIVNTAPEETKEYQWAQLIHKHNIRERRNAGTLLIDEYRPSVEFKPIKFDTKPERTLWERIISELRNAVLI